MRFAERVRKRLPEYPPYYEAPAGEHLRLDQNANLLGPNPHVAGARLDLSTAHLYPHRDNGALLAAAGRFFRTDPRKVFCANGSDEILDILLRTLVEPGGRVVAPHPSYSLYPHLCRLNRLVHVPVPLGPDFQVTSRPLLDARPDLVLVANPNNPTGTPTDGRVLGELLRGFDGPVVVDEAYAEFSGQTLIPLIDQFPNLIVTRTLSKAAGLAGLRVGFGVAAPDVAELVRRNKIPFSVNILSEQLAIAAMADAGPIEATVRTVGRERESLARALDGLGFRVVPSQANFLLTLPPVPSDELYESLRRHHILARVFPNVPALADYIRFTVAQPEDNRRLLDALRKILDTGGSS